MSHSENDRFGDIVLSLGYCTADQIRRCLSIQQNTKENLSLGQSLLREGFISGEQYSEVLRQFRVHVKRDAREAREPSVTKPAPKAAHTAEDREDDLLGKLAVREGWLTPEDLKTCRQAEKAGAPRRPLGEILVSGGYLSAARAQDLLTRVSRRMMGCPVCKKTFTVLSIALSRAIACPVCKGPLEEETIPASRPEKNPVATGTFKAVTQALPPSRQPRIP